MSSLTVWSKLSNIIQLDYPFDIVDTQLSDTDMRPIKFSHGEKAMCGLTADLIDFDELSPTQKQTLVKGLERKKSSLQAQLEEVTESLKGINRCLKKVQKTPKPRSARRPLK
jgi:hypothetical protein